MPLTMEEQVAALTTATNALITEVSTKKISLDTSETNAAISAAASLASKNAAGVSEVNAEADKVQTGLDRIKTTADRAQTAIDLIATTADRAAIVADKALINIAIANAVGMYYVQATYPPASLLGTQWFDTYAKALKFWNGVEWEVLHFTKFSPVIGYRFGTADYIQDSVTKNMLLANRGSNEVLGNATLQTGRALQLGATNTLPIPTFVGGYIIYHNIGTDTITQESTNGTPKSFISITLNNILPTHTAFNATDLAKIQVNPNLLAKLALSATGTIPELDMILVGDEGYYCGSEDSGAYCVDAKSVVDDANVLIRNFVDTLAGATVTSVSINAYEGTVESNGVGSSAELALSHVHYLTSSGIHYFTMEVNLISGINFMLDKFYFGSTSSYSYTKETIGSIVKYKIFFNKSSDDIVGYPYFIPYINTGIAGKVSLKFSNVRQATAQEISNYAETIRTNVDFNPKGLQTTPLVLDGVGVPMAYVEDRLVKNISQTITFPLTPTPVVYTPTKDIADITGNATSLVITHSDLTTVTIP